MVGTVRRMAGAVLMLAAALAAPGFAQEVLTPERAIPDHYIVVLNDEEMTRARVSVRGAADDLARRHGGRLTRVYERALRGFAVRLPAARAAALARDPRVRYVEQDSVMEIVATQSTQPGVSTGSTNATCH